MKSVFPLYKTENTTCCVYGCYSKVSYRSYNAITFHKIPFDRSRSLLRKWVDAIKLPKRIGSHMVVCSRHFVATDYYIIDGEKQLKPGSAPSQNLPRVWRNKFLPRNYGRLIKAIEVRGIGRLRLCFEAKLGRILRQKSIERKQQRKEKRIQIKQITKPAETDKEQIEILDSPKTTQSDLVVLNILGNAVEEEKKSNSGNSLKPTTNQTEKEQGGEEHSLTSEIFIKDEPLSDIEEPEEVDEMLATINEYADDAHVTHVDNITKPTCEFDEKIQWISLLCDICGEDDCEGHEEEKFECVPCNKQFKTSRQLNAHNLSHFEYRKRSAVAEKEPVCKVCNKALSSKVSLSEHMLTHSNDKKHVCMLCDKIFRSKASLVMHINSHTIHPNHRCKICGQCFMDSDELDRHVRKHKVMTREYTCRECGQHFKTQEDCWAHLNSHMRAKSRSGLSCDICGRTLSTRATLKEHMFIHSGEKPFECQLCGRKIRHRANFIIHVQGHSLGQPHLCSLCGMGFSKKTELCSHTAAEHPEDKPYFCIICGMRFRTEARFHRHAISHDACLEE